MSDYKATKESLREDIALAKEELRDAKDDLKAWKRDLKMWKKDGNTDLILDHMEGVESAEEDIKDIQKRIVDLKQALRDLTSPRATTVCIIQPIGNTLTIHFCDSPLNTENRMYPIWIRETAFQAIERIMIAEGVAHNVTSVEELRHCGESTDYEIIYNKGRNHV